MGLLSKHETIVWKEFHKGKSTRNIADESKGEWSPSYVSRVLNRTRKKIAKALAVQAKSHRLDIETLLDYKGLLVGFDYQANAQVYILFTEKYGIIVWYKHNSYAGKLCPDCPKDNECTKILKTISEEYNIDLRQDEKDLLMTKRSISILNKLALKQIPRYKRIKEEE